MSQVVEIKFDIDGTYFEVDLREFEALEDEQLLNMPTTRKKWNRVLITNRPYEYLSDTSDKNKLYDIIVEKSPSDYIYIRHTGDDSVITEGYFGVIDCEINDDHTGIWVEPTIYDNYTPLLEFMDTKVNVFENTNLVYNPDFNIVTSGLPAGWEYVDAGTYVAPDIDTLLNLKSATLRMRREFFQPDKDERQCLMLQEIGNIGIGRNIDFSFKYQLLELWNPISYKSKLYVKISLTDGVETKYVNNEGQWEDTDTTYVYDPNKLPLPADDIKSYESKRLIIAPPTISGTMTIRFYNTFDQIAESIDNSRPINASEYPAGDLLNNVYYESDLYITDVNVFSSNIVFKTVDVKLSSDDLVHKNQNQIQKINGTRYANEFSAYPTKKDVEEHESGGKSWIEIYFDTYGEPNYSALGDSGSYPPHDSDNVNYENFGKVLEDEEDHGFYKGEICELTIYSQPGYSWFWDSILPTQKMICRAVAVFAREERYSTDKYTQADADAGKCTEAQVGVDYRPPEYGVEWGKLRENEPSIPEDDKLGALWVRAPFNSASSEWQLDDLVEERGRNDYGFDYAKKIHSKKIYPSESTSYTTCMDLRGIIERVFHGTNAELINKNVYSTFLFNDYPSDPETTILLDRLNDLGVNSDSNYATMKHNFLSNTVALHTFDLKEDKSSADNDSLLEISFKELMEDIMIIYPHTYYKLMDDGSLRIEHKSFEDIVNDFYDARSLIEFKQKWKYDKDNMFALIDFTQVNSGYKDFAYSQYEFEKIATNRRRIDIRETKGTRFITTDIQYCMENADDISNGLILINYFVNGDTNEIQYGTGQISENDVPNGLLSLANMMAVFGKHEGTFTNGLINGKQYEFNHSKWTKLPIEDIELKGIYTGNYFLTTLGIGFAANKVLDYVNGTTTVSCLYRYTDEYLITTTDDLIDF